MRLFHSKEFILFDLEYTSWPGAVDRQWSAPWEHREIIAIGALKVNAKTLTIVDRFHCLIQPRINPSLSSYIEQLTGIYNADIAEHGVDLLRMLEAFSEFVGGQPCGSYGWDILIIMENLLLRQVQCSAFFLSDDNRLELSLDESAYDETDDELRLPAYGRAVAWPDFLEKARDGIALMAEWGSAPFDFSLRAYDLRSWVLAREPRLHGRSSGELAAYFGHQSDGLAHDPIHDVESLLFALSMLLNDTLKAQN